MGELKFESTSVAHGALIFDGFSPERWTFEASGFLMKPRVTIRKAGADDNLAVYRPKFYGGGWLEFVNGSRFQWKSINFRRTEWGFYNAQDELLYVLKPNLFDLLKVRSRGDDELFVITL